MKASIKYILLFILLCAASCEKEPQPDPPQELPPITTEGLNTFGCKINGEVWVAETDFSINGPVAVGGYYNSTSGEFSISGTLRCFEEDINQSVRIQGRNIFKQGKYKPYVSNTGNTINVGFRDYKSEYGCFDYKHDSLNPGKINIIKLDTINDIVSGTFEMDLHSEDCEGLLIITEGRFDYKYTY